MSRPLTDFTGDALYLDTPSFIPDLPLTWPGCGRFPIFYWWMSLHPI